MMVTIIQNRVCKFLCFSIVMFRFQIQTSFFGGRLHLALVALYDSSEYDELVVKSGLMTYELGGGDEYEAIYFLIPDDGVVSSLWSIDEHIVSGRTQCISSRTTNPSRRGCCFSAHDISTKVISVVQSLWSCWCSQSHCVVAFPSVVTEWCHEMYMCFVMP